MDPSNEIGEEVTITERSRLLSMTPEEAKKIKSLRIENQLIDDEISRKTEVFAGVPDQVYFVDYSIRW